jgi:XTP/dITP diphosphohydrolase
MFDAAGVTVVDLLAAGIPEAPEEADLEHADTFEGNALAKAHYFCRHSGLPTIADDSGLEVAALGGAPGVRSKRWSGRDDLEGQALDDANNALLLARLERVADRSARYVCAAAYCEDGTSFVERGESAGVIIPRPRGTGGFGYDPYFESVELGRTFAEVSREEKSRVSHRGRAFAKLLRRLIGRG